MLATYVTISPLSKFVLIEDCLEHKGEDILQSILRMQAKHSCKIHYFQFEGLFKNRPNFLCYDCVSNCKSWLQGHIDHFVNVVDIEDNSIIVIDSLVHAVHLYGFKTVYDILKRLISKKEIFEIVSIFHEDLDNGFLQYFRSLSTFVIQLQPNSNRVLYVYKKPSGKIIRQTETYSTNNGILTCEKIGTVDPKKLVQEISKPESLATFKIGLNDDERALRDKVVLPYLYRDEDEKRGGEIFYELDNMDDWDEEDPDDDLDI